jgi:hypothetical protein
MDLSALAKARPGRAVSGITEATIAAVITGMHVIGRNGSNSAPSRLCDAMTYGSVVRWTVLSIDLPGHTK